MQVTVRGTELTLTPLLVVVFVLGVAVAGYGAYDYVQQTQAVDDAVAVDTTVVETSVRESSGRRVYYRVSVTHTYEYEGTEYTSTRVFPGETSPTYFVRSDAVGVADSTTAVRPRPPTYPLTRRGRRSSNARPHSPPSSSSGSVASSHSSRRYGRLAPGTPRRISLPVATCGSTRPCSGWTVGRPTP